MGTPLNTKDQTPNRHGQSISLFKDIERRASDLSLNGARHPFKWHQNINGLLSLKQIDANRHALNQLSVDDYVSTVLDSAESANRPSAKKVVSQLRGKIHSEFELGPLYSVELSLEYQDQTRRLALIVQDRSVANGVWSPEHHIEACRLIDEYARRAVPIVTFMDTPGADAGTEANAANQAHSISRFYFWQSVTPPSILFNQKALLISHVSTTFLGRRVLDMSACPPLNCIAVVPLTE